MRWSIGVALLAGCGGEEEVDLDLDGFGEEDCDDADASVHPGAGEVCDGIDQDCNGEVDDGVGVSAFGDADGDGVGAGDPVIACEVGAGLADVAGDCDDADPTSHPGALEACDGADNDCDGAVDDGVAGTWYRDDDGDGFGSVEVQACDEPYGASAVAGDCDDTDPTAFPDADEACDGVDQDCDGEVDEGVKIDAYPDADGDGSGAIDSAAVQVCAIGAGQAAGADDCDDARADVHPGAAEACDEVDQDCDGQIDEGAQSVFWPDADADGFGDSAVSEGACEAPDGWIAVGGDCDDTDAARHPGLAEVCDGVDQDCDAVVDEGVTVSWFADADGDSWGALVATEGCAVPPSGTSPRSGDCNDAVASVHPGAVEVCDSLDQDCDLAIDEGVTVHVFTDADGDTFGDPTQPAEACSVPPGSASRSGDCDDLDPTVHAGAAEVCDGADQDCDGLPDDGLMDQWFTDLDHDDYGVPPAVLTCAPTADMAHVSGDCNDADAAIRPDAPEVCDAVDQDCDGVADDGLMEDWFADADADNYGVPPAIIACARPAGTASASGDCNDGSATIHPGAPEVCDLVDQDCDSVPDDGVTIVWYADVDGDGWGAIAPPAGSCTLPTGAVTRTGDCDDNQGGTYPGAPEACDFVDQSCDGVADEGLAFPVWTDADGDGLGVTDGGAVRACAIDPGFAWQAGDCDDLDAAIGADCVPDVTGEWPTYGGDDGRTGHVAGLAAGGAVVQLWSWSSPGEYIDPPTLTGGQVLLTVNTWVYNVDDQLVALDAGTGVQNWARTVVDSFGPSSASVENGSVYLQRIESSDSQVLAFDEATGASLWQSSLGAQWEHYFAPLVLDGRVIVAGGTYSGMYSFNATTGVQQWFAYEPQYDEWTPVAANGIVYSLVQNLFTARKPATGVTQWEIAYDDVPWTGYDMDTVPAAAEDTAVFVLGEDLHAVDLVTHTDRWVIEDGFIGSPTIADGLVYAIRDGELVQLALDDGFRYAGFPGDGALVGKPVVTDDVVVVASTEATFVYRLWDGFELSVLTTGGDLAVGENLIVTVFEDTATAWQWQ